MTALRLQLPCFAAADDAAASQSGSEDAGEASLPLGGAAKAEGPLAAAARALALGVGTRLALLSDDTYAFAAAMKVCGRFLAAQGLAG